jgi:hypothetical protein
MSSRPKSLSGEAVQFYKSGQPFLQHNLPFWMASLVGHLLVLLIPIVAVLYPMMRFLPALYGWLMRRKIARLCGELRFLEDEITGGESIRHFRDQDFVAHSAVSRSVKF